MASEVSKKLLLAIDPIVLLREDPAERFPCGTPLLLHAVMEYPLLGAFLSRLPMPTANSSLAGIGFVTRDLDAGIASKRFPGISLRVALDLVIGSLFSAAHSLAGESLEGGYPVAIVKAVLQGLGVKEKKALRFVAQPLPKLALTDASILKMAQHQKNDYA